mmetsp:Transcript_8645/g.22335  ORF Transcript_8645/g.22335 Transcript_8645/m.22335 type:complete len:422 (+) Transcript_8645:109-1374(+)
MPPRGRPSKKPRLAGWQPPTSAAELLEACAGPVTVGGETKHGIAGDTDAADDAACFAADLEWHTVLPPPGPDDWLAGPGEIDREGQSFRQYGEEVGVLGRRPRASRAQLWLPSPGCSTIYLVRLSGSEAADPEWEAAAPDLTVLAHFVSLWFCVPCVVLPDGPEHRVRARSRPSCAGKVRWRQLLTTDLHDHLDSIKAKTPDAFAVLGLTMHDLYPDDDFNFVFGEASSILGTGVFSFARLRPGFPRHPAGGRLGPEHAGLFLRRALDLVVHELGHLFRIKHCVHFMCNMNGVNTLDEADGKPLRLCPCDLRKLALAVRHCAGPTAFRVRERYAKLHRFFAEHGLHSEAEWTDRRVRALAEARGGAAAAEESEDVLVEDSQGAGEDHSSHEKKEDHDGEEEILPVRLRLAQASGRSMHARE